MRFYMLLYAFIAAIVISECNHTFMGTNVLRQLVYHRDVKFSSQLFRKRVENVTFQMPASYGYGRTIQGILAYDLTNTGATANVTAGGIAYPYVTLRMKSDRGHEIHYALFIYA